MRKGIQVFRKLPKLKEKYRVSLNKLINTGWLLKSSFPEPL